MTSICALDANTLPHHLSDLVSILRSFPFCVFNLFISTAPSPQDLVSILLPLKPSSYHLLFNQHFPQKTSVYYLSSPNTLSQFPFKSLPLKTLLPNLMTFFMSRPVLSQSYLLAFKRSLLLAFDCWFLLLFCFIVIFLLVLLPLPSISSCSFSEVVFLFTIPFKTMQSSHLYMV